MTKLKTLKDLGTFGDFAICGCGEEVTLEGVPRDELKQEAIKWFKLKGDEILKLRRGELAYKESKTQSIASRIGQRKFIKHFFNITEGDLNGNI